MSLFVCFFGLSIASYLFTKILKPVFAWLDHRIWVVHIKVPILEYGTIETGLSVKLRNPSANIAVFGFWH